MGQRSNTLLQSKAQRSWHQTPITPLLLFPLQPPALPACLRAPRKDSLEKAVGSRNQPEGVNEDSSADVRALVPQAGLPWPLAGQHVPATVDSPQRLGLPAHCGDTPTLSVIETPVTPAM